MWFLFYQLDTEQQREQYICNDSIDSISNNHKTGPRWNKMGNYFLYQLFRIVDKCQNMIYNFSLDIYADLLH